MNRLRLYAALAALIVPFGARFASAQDIDWPGELIDAAPAVPQNSAELSIPTLDPSRLSSRLSIPAIDVAAPASQAARSTRQPSRLQDSTCRSTQTPCAHAPLILADRRQDPGADGGAQIRWVDIGHWTWTYASGVGNSQSGEVYYAPASIATEKISEGVVHDVVVRIAWRVDREGKEHVDRSSIGLKTHRFWRLAIFCNENRWARAWQRSYHAHYALHDHGPAQGPYPIAVDSVPAVLKDRLCR